MKFTEKALEQIDMAYTANRRESAWECGLGINVRNGISGAKVYVNNWEVCPLEDLEQMIEELAIMRDTIKETIGIY